MAPLARRLLLAAGLCARLAGAYYDCQLRPKPAVKDPDSVMSAALPGCDREQKDFMEDVAEVAQLFSQEEPVQRSELAKAEWHQVLTRSFPPEGVEEIEGFESVAGYAARGRLGGTLSEGDAEALAALARHSDEPMDCQHSNVACAPESGSGSGPLRVVALRFRPDGDGTAWVEPLSRLTALQGLTLILGPSERAGMSAAQLEKLYWPGIRALELLLSGVDASTEPSLVAVGRLRSLRYLYVQPGKYEEFKFSLEAYCDLVELRYLSLPDMNIHEVPECFQSFRKLRYLYLSCNYLTSAPRALRELPELRGFVAFRQGEYTPCHLRGSPPSNLKERKRMKEIYGDCKYIWETRMGIDAPKPDSPEDDPDNPRVVCPWVAFRDTLQDWLDLRWPRIEKVWLDGNFISGPIPEELPQLWPHIRSLDLYNNNLTGPIPPSFGEVPWVKLQLQERSSGRRAATSTSPSTAI